MRKTSLVASLAVVWVLAGCGTPTAPVQPTPTPEPGAPQLVAITPDEIPADYAGEILLAGAGFDPSAQVLVNGAPIAVPGISVTYLSEYEIRLDVAYSGAGMELLSGLYPLTVQQNGLTSTSANLRVVPVLGDVEHLATNPRVFTEDGGAFDVWVRPMDSDGEFIGPQHVLAPGGLDWSHFQLDNISVTRLSDATPMNIGLAGVADVIFQPGGDETPLAVAITIDQSGSMIGLGSNPVPSDPDDIRIDGSQMFVDAMGSKDQAAVIRFDCPCPPGVNVVQDLTGDKNMLKAALDSLRNDEGGNTPLYQAIDVSIDTVAATNMAKKAVVVLTDGRNTEAGPTPDELIAKAQDNDVAIYAIGLGNPNDPLSLDRAELTRIGQLTGGAFFFAEDANALIHIFDGLTAILVDSYKLEAAVTFDLPLTQAGSYQVDGDLVTRVDDREVVFDLEPFTVSLIN